MSAPTSARAISSTASWSWYSAESAISGARWSAPSRSASPTSSWSRLPAPCSVRSPFSFLSFCSFKSGRAACSRSRAVRWKHDPSHADAIAGPWRDHIPVGCCRAGRADPAVQPVAARRLFLPGADLPRRALGQVCLLRHPRAVDRPDLGLLRHPLAWPRRLLRARRLRHGDVFDAADRDPRRLRQSDLARLHGVPELLEIAVVLARLRHVLVRGADGAVRARPARLLLRL